MGKISKNIKIIDTITDAMTSPKDELIESGPFSAKQMSFLMEYAKTGNVAESLKIAKYTEGTYRVDLQSNPTLKQAVAKIQRLVIAKATTGKATTEGQLAEVIDVLHNKVIVDDNIKAAGPLLKAIDMKMKQDGMYAKHNVSAGQKVIINIDTQKHMEQEVIDIDAIEASLQ